MFAGFLQTIDVPCIREQRSDAVLETGFLARTRHRSIHCPVACSLGTNILEQYKPAAFLLLGEILIDDLVTCSLIGKSQTCFVQYYAEFAFCSLIREKRRFDEDLLLRYCASGR